jgi:hypothetical protein
MTAPNAWRNPRSCPADNSASATVPSPSRALRTILILCVVALHLSQSASLRAQPGATNTPASSGLDWIKVSTNKHGFVYASSGRPFIPWGFNYDRDYKSRLLEDYWETEWPTVVEHFRQMKQLGANVVRVHLQFIEGSKDCAAGWIGFYWGQTPVELSRSTSIGDSLTAAWLRLFREMNPN